MAKNFLEKHLKLNKKYFLKQNIEADQLNLILNITK